MDEYNSNEKKNWVGLDDMGIKCANEALNLYGVRCIGMNVKIILLEHNTSSWK